MIRHFVSAIAMVTMAVPPALAQEFSTAREELELFGRAEPACVTRAPAAVAGINANFDPSADSGGEIRIVQLVDQTTAEPMPASITLAIPVICNSSHRVTLSSQNGGLLRDSGDSRRRQSGNGFGEFVPYELNFAWAGQEQAVSSEAARSIAFNVQRGAAGEATFRFVLPAGGGALLAGRYSDAVVIEFTPAN
jgi:hypothetical protein